MSVSGVQPRLHHVGLTVSDVERSAAFYATHLGFTAPGRIAEVRDDWISGVTGLPGTSLRVAFLANEGLTLELIEYVAPKGRPAVETTTADAGSAHVAVEVTDIEAHCARMEAAGVRFVSHPQLVTSGGWKGRKLAYLLDPDGAVVELIEPAGSESG